MLVATALQHGHTNNINVAVIHSSEVHLTVGICEHSSMQGHSERLSAVRPCTTVVRGSQKGGRGRGEGGVWGGMALSVRSIPDGVRHSPQQPPASAPAGPVMSWLPRPHLASARPPLETPARTTITRDQLIPAHQLTPQVEQARTSGTLPCSQLIVDRLAAHA